ncbi:MAG: leucine-rich repeat domain-containing protein, partial [Anaeroplasmataceae bacterium]|nr:leucine-rich repeat domain-containing protein [Anaeroplasmataceae bacterium]
SLDLAAKNSVPVALKTIDYGAFAGWSGLTSLRLPFVGTSKGNTGNPSFVSYIFTGEINTNMQGVEYGYFPPKCTKVEITEETVIDCGFRFCSNIEELILPNTVNSMASACLRGCTGLIKLVIPFVGSAVNSTGEAGTFGWFFNHTVDSYYPWNKYCPSWVNYVDGKYTHQYYAKPELDKMTGAGTKLAELPPLTDDNNTELEINFDRSYAFDHLVYPAYYGDMENGCLVADEEERYNIGQPAGNQTSGRYSATTHYIADYPLALKNVEILKEQTLAVGAFMNFSSVEEFVLPNTLNEIQAYAFFNCTNYKKFEVPDNIVKIGDYAYYNCDSFETIDLPTQLTVLGNFAFANCDGIKQLTVPEHLTSIGSHCFAECKSIGTDLADDEVAIEFKSSYIGEYMFAGCTGIKELTIPDNVTALPEGAFMNCTGLQSLHFNGDFEYVGDYGFYKCINLKEITLNKTKRLGNFAFAYCENLLSIEIPEEVQEVGTHIFAYCYGLKYAVINTPNLGKYMFYKCHQLRGSTNPEDGSKSTLIFPEGTINIPGWCFAYCYELEDILFPESLLTIEDYAFYMCNHKLQRIELPSGCEVLGEHAFQECDVLEEVILSRDLHTLRSFAFYGCENLKSIKLPQGLKVIEPYALAECYLLEELIVPKSVEKIGEGAFYGLQDLHTLIIPFAGLERGGTDGVEALFGYIFGGDTVDYTAANGEYQTSTYVKDNMYVVNEDGVASGYFVELEQIYAERKTIPTVSLLAEGDDETDPSEEEEPVEENYELIQKTIKYYLPRTLSKVYIYDEPIFGYGAMSNFDWLDEFYYHQMDFEQYNKDYGFTYTEDDQHTTTEKFLDYSFYNCDGFLSSSFIRMDETGRPYFGFFGSEHNTCTHDHE